MQLSLLLVHTTAMGVLAISVVLNALVITESTINGEKREQMLMSIRGT